MSEPRQTDTRPGRSRSPVVHIGARTALARERARRRQTERTLETVRADLLRQLAECDRMEHARNVARRESRDIGVRFDSAFHRAAIGMALVDMEGRWILANEALCRIVGRSRSDLERTTLAEIVHPEDVDLDAALLRNLLDGAIPSYQSEKRLRHASGHDLWALMTVSLVRGRHGAPMHFVTQVQDISERKETAARQEYLIDHDSLTGLFNRRRFHQEVAREDQRLSRYGAVGAVLMIDLDNFKGVNDAFGHGAGDDLLSDVAGALRNRMRQNDVVARVGGDEFAMLLPETDTDQARIVAEGLVKSLRRRIATVGGRAIDISASVGVAPLDGLGPGGSLECADVAMYEAKQTGGNRVAVFHSGDEGADRVVRRTGVGSTPAAVEQEPTIAPVQTMVGLPPSRASAGSSAESATPAPSCRAAPRTGRTPARHS